MGVIKWLDENIEEFIMTVCLVAMVLIMGVQVAMRYFFNASLVWSEELTRYFFIWSGFLSVSYCIKRRISIKIDQVFNMLPHRVQQVIQFFIKIVMLAVFLYFFRYSIEVVKATIANGQKSPAMGLPIYFVQMSTIVGFFLASVRIIQNIYHGIIHIKE
jgi:TRAP-type C4-dicarboxylate transport system permease small subunit